MKPYKERIEYFKERYKKDKKKILARKKQWVKENPEKAIKHHLTYNAKYPIKNRALKYAHRHKQRGDTCVVCNTTIDLHFHHTNYEKYEGTTLCRKCHTKEHNRIKLKE